MLTEQFLTYEITERRFMSDSYHIEEPRKCNHCNNTGEQIFLSGVITDGKDDPYDAICIFKCYYCEFSSLHFMKDRWSSREKINYLTSENSIPAKKNIDSSIIENELVIDKFPDFLKIYQQSQKALDEGLDQIAGMGFRKSLEFLVSDFLISYPPEGVTIDWVENPKTTLSKKIEKLKNERLKRLAKAISFIGNDETHYTRRHPEYDIDSIKAFIRGFISTLDNELIMLDAEKLINKDS